MLITPRWLITGLIATLLVVVLALALGMRLGAPAAPVSNAGNNQGAVDFRAGERTPLSFSQAISDRALVEFRAGERAMQPGL
jgi:hypothetical protein